MELKLSILRTHWISVLGIAASYWIGTLVTSDELPWEAFINPFKLVVLIISGLLFSLLATLVTYPILFLEVVLVDVLLVGYIKNSYVVAVSSTLMGGTYLYCAADFRRVDLLFDGVVIAVIALSQLLRLVPMERIQRKMIGKA